MNGPNQLLVMRAALRWDIASVRHCTRSSRTLSPESCIDSCPLLPSPSNWHINCIRYSLFRESPDSHSPTQERLTARPWSDPPTNGKAQTTTTVRTSIPSSWP